MFLETTFNENVMKQQLVISHVLFRTYFIYSQELVHYLESRDETSLYVSWIRKY